MEIFAKTEALRLHLYHLALLFFHQDAENFSIECKESETEFFVQLTKNKITKSASAKIDLSLHKEASRASNAALGKAFSLAAKAFTDYLPPYGILFGVRPVKVPLFYLKNGSKKEEIFRILCEEFFVSSEKADLLRSLAETEMAFEEKFNKNDGMLYLSIPFCPSRCHYCSFISSSAPKHLQLIPQYVEKLQEEISMTASLFSETGKKLRAVYMGGGTPGILTAEQMQSILSLVKNQFDFSSCEEFCVEIGRPDTITDEKLFVLKNMGVDRISINPQSTNNETLKRIGRGHSAEVFLSAMEKAKTFHFPSINCDLIAGLDGETPEDFLSSLSTVLSLSPEEITIHALCKKRSAEEKNLPSFALSWQEAMTSAHKTCINQGFAPYYLYRQKNAAADLENTGFSKRDSFGIYNLAMMEDLCDIFACGAGAISKILPKHKNEKILRFAGYKYPFEYLSDEEKIKSRLNEMKLHL
ncbi:MAG: coproporphyrinogen dehydrogenase HemZ [Clostridia bacterium]|nr:coproporphyrinogen dehydrogenase HemZ [Clostridia bacterium]